MNDIVIYTAVYGEGYELSPPLAICKNIDYVCFSDRDLKVPGWRVMITSPSGIMSQAKQAKQKKILVHRFFPHHELSLYVDCTRSGWLSGNIEKTIKFLLDGDVMAMRKHRSRKCLYVEARHCIKMGKDSESVITKQIDGYAQEGMPERFGLYEGNGIFRRRSAIVKELCEVWWKEVRSKSQRDQISLPYAMWKTGIRVRGFSSKNPYK